MSKKEKEQKAFAAHVNAQLNFIMLTSEVNTLIQIYTDYKDLMYPFMRESFDTLLENHYEAFSFELEHAFPNHPFEMSFETLATMPIYPIETKMFKAMEEDYVSGVKGGYGVTYKAIAQVARLRELNEHTTALNSPVFKAHETLKSLTQAILMDMQQSEAENISREDYLKLHQELYLPVFIGTMKSILPLTDEEFQAKMEEYFASVNPKDAHQVIDEPAVEETSEQVLH